MQEIKFLSGEIYEDGNALFFLDRIIFKTMLSCVRARKTCISKCIFSPSCFYC